MIVLQSRFRVLSRSSCRDEARRGIFRQYSEEKAGRQATEGAKSGLQAPSRGESRPGRNATKVEACIWAPEASGDNFGINA